MHVIIAPDKFKGSLSSFEVCKAIEAGVMQAIPYAICKTFPMADGGDGFAEVLKWYKQTTTVDCTTENAVGKTISATYEWEEKTLTAIIELASASGLAQLAPHEIHALGASTYGTGLMINDAVTRGAKKIVLGLGGSATTDAGTGILSAFGFRFLDEQERALQPCGQSLCKIHEILLPQTLPQIQFEVASDVQNVLHGPTGAAYTYSAQKGASRDDIELLDKGLRRFASVIKKQCKSDVSSVPGTGAAGGVAAGLMAFFPTQMKSGIHLVMEASGIHKALANADIVITGEGKMDDQTLQGKVIDQIAAIARKKSIATIAICGLSENTEQIKSQLGLKAIISLVNDTVAKDAAMKNGNQLITERIGEFFQSGIVLRSEQ